MKSIKVLMLGDVSGDPGKRALFLGLSSLVKITGASLVVVNGENASQGFGIECEDYYSFKQMGIDVITSGNHIWQRSEIYPLLDSQKDLLRPINYTSSVPGHGVCTLEKDGIKFAVVNVQGRVDMPITEDPFRISRQEIEKLNKQGYITLVDLHAESSIEKEALAFHLDGLCSAVVGTHTHVQTMDERILPQGTAYITDIGMTGVQDMVIGSDPTVSIHRQLTQVPVRSVVAEGNGVIKGVLIEIDTETRRAIKIERI